MTAVDPVHRPVSFGYFLVPNAASPLIATAQRVERLGLDYVGIQDHPYQRNFADTWSLMAMIAASTTTLRIFPDVANLPLRPPAVMAKAAATIDLLSGGRFELGLGAGGFWDAIEAYGGPRRGPGEALGALEEAITVIRKVWSGERNLRFEGSHYRLAGAQSGPVPPHEIGIWLGVYGPRALELTGRAADGWIPSFRGDIGQIAQMSSRLDDAVAAAGLAAGRRPASPQRLGDRDRRVFGRHVPRAGYPVGRRTGRGRRLLRVRHVRLLGRRRRSARSLRPGGGPRGTRTARRVAAAKCATWI